MRGTRETETLSREALRTMGRFEVLRVAQARGYDFPKGAKGFGLELLVDKFLVEQEKSSASTEGFAGIFG